MAGPITKPDRRNLTLGENLQAIRFLDRDLGTLMTALHFKIERGKVIAAPEIIFVFQASRGWVQKFSRRNKVQPSLSLDRKGDRAMPPFYAERMEEIRHIASQYDPKNVYNQDESGLLYRMGPSQTYLTSDEHRATTNGTELQNWKQRLTIVFCVNADGSHKLAMKYIGKYAVHVCFRDHPNCAPRYSSQSNGWMDTEGFMSWTHWWYDEVKKHSTGPWLLIMDNCGGHVDIALPVKRIEFLPKNCKAVYQPLDKGLISQAKIRCRSLLLCEIIDIISQVQSGKNSFKENSERERWGRHEGQLPHVADAMRLMDQSWSSTTQSAIIKCWLNSSCLPQSHIEILRPIIGGQDALHGRLQLLTTDADVYTLFYTTLSDFSHRQENIEVVPLYIQECDRVIKILEVLGNQSAHLMAEDSLKEVFMKALNRAKELRGSHCINSNDC